MRVMVAIMREVEVPDKFLPLVDDVDGDYFELHQEFCEYIPKIVGMPLSSNVEEDYMGDSIDAVYEKGEWTPLIEC